MRECGTDSSGSG